MAHRTGIILIGLMIHASPTFAHDTWVQTNINIIRTGDVVHVDLMLGNHGNEHRDFKLAGKTTLEDTVLRVTSPSGKSYDLKSDLVDTGYTPKEGFWSGLNQWSALSPLRFRDGRMPLVKGL